ncbi:LAQU0S06e02762g1_1 [Lachancea quebecensis]|uniref:N-(5'-phosphoribosyl)anthranilate isomerase n=1 Tax=Lachancea quebecensis TaxID=1654605 RepID=A0A0N7MLL8_9SACH|nr:LAQU0S06e02762g1_1 [Lachancea quebecensis]
MNFWKDTEILTKICGIQSADAAEVAIDAGASLIGVICVPNRKRTVSPIAAQEISRVVRAARQERQVQGKPGPFLVGVFRNQTISEIRALKEDYGLDIIQLHGHENWRAYKSELENTPIIKRFIFPNDCADVLELSESSLMECLPLFDSEAGGTGERLDWDAIASWNKDLKARFILAGGLGPENVKKACSLPGVMGVDVSGGVETQGNKDADKIRAFLAEAR